MRRAAAALLALVLAGPAAAGLPPAEFAAFAFRQQPGARLPLEVELRDAAGRPLRLADLFGGPPVLIDFDYDRCTVLCGVLLDRIAAALAALPLRPGRDYRLVAIDIDPQATPQQAAAFAAAHGAAGAAVLTGDAAAIRRLAEAAGFPYRRDPASGQYAHPAGLVVATPDGTISRYLLGLDWRPLDLRLALAEAAAAAVAPPADRVLLFCYHYDPQSGRYDLAVGRLLEIVGAASLAAVAGLVWAARRRPG